MTVTMRNLLAKLWKDPVWSKVISVAILTVIAFLWTQFISPFLSQSRWHALISFLEYTIPVNLSIIVLLLLLVFIAIFRKSSKKSYQNKLTTLVHTRNLEPSRLLKSLPKGCQVRRPRHGELEVFMNTKDAEDANN